jgi:nucleoside phosphorylase
MENRRFLLVTANEHETNALLADRNLFSYVEQQSTNPEDVLYYRIGKFGNYEAVHFELPEQGSVGADASFASVLTAIEEFHPDAVILVGIAFGRDCENALEPCQHIGDVLISKKIADYDSGKIKADRLQPDGYIAEAGRFLFAAFKKYAKSWAYSVNGTPARCHLGTVLSGDKVVDDSTFKKNLFEAYPRAIGGEMEGRGAYSACRRKNLNEWIIVKGICDWADGTKSVNKEARQMLAAKSTVDLLRHVFCDEGAFDKLPSNYSVQVPIRLLTVAHLWDNPNYISPPYLTELVNRLKDQSDKPRIQLSGSGGMGKTTTLLHLYHYFAEVDVEAYDYIAYLQYNGNEDEMLLQLEAPSDSNPVSFLSSLAQGKRILLLVDDVTKNMDPYQVDALRMISASVVFACRQPNNAFSQIDVSAKNNMLSLNDCCNLFLRSRHGAASSRLSPKERDILCEIIVRRAAKNLLICQRLGIMAKEYSLSPSGLEAVLEVQGFVLPCGEADSSIEEQIIKLYPIDKLTDFERSMIEAFSFFPALVQDADVWVRWLKEDAGVDKLECRRLLHKLAETTWLTAFEDGEAYGMHPLVFRAVRIQKQPGIGLRHDALLHAMRNDLIWQDDSTPEKMRTYLYATMTLKNYLYSTQLISGMLFHLEHKAGYCAIRIGNILQKSDSGDEGSFFFHLAEDFLWSASHVMDGRDIQTNYPLYIDSLIGIGIARLLLGNDYENAALHVFSEALKSLIDHEKEVGNDEWTDSNIKVLIKWLREAFVLSGHTEDSYDNWLCSEFGIHISKPYPPAIIDLYYSGEKALKNEEYVLAIQLYSNALKSLIEFFEASGIKLEDDHLLNDIVNILFFAFVHSGKAEDEFVDWIFDEFGVTVHWEEPPREEG